MANTAILDGLVSSPAPPSAGQATIAAPASQLAGTNLAASVQGSAPLGGIHNTPLHIALWGASAVGVILFMHKMGFRLLSVGRYGGGR
jgi:hypothetical protein